LNSPGAAECVVLVVMNSVWPSGAAFATAAAAGMPPAPERFSTMNGWPSASWRCVAIERAVASVTLPAANGVMMVTGRDG
jgi:hypothetical protein